jgi:hypothetical protein
VTFLVDDAKMQRMKPRCDWMKRVAHTLATFTVVLACAAAVRADRPDAVVVVKPTPQLLCSLFPALARLGHPPLLIHAAGNEPYITEYLSQIGAQRVWLVDADRAAPEEWQKKFETWSGPPADTQWELVRRCWPAAESIVLVGDGDADLIVSASLLATARGIPALCLHEPANAEQRETIRRLGVKEIVRVGSDVAGDFTGVKRSEFQTAAEVLAAYDAALGEPAPEHLVVLGSGRQLQASRSSDFSPLAPQYAARHRAAVAFVDRNANIEAQIQKLVSECYPAVKYITLWGDTKSLPDEEVDDPVLAAGLETKLTEPKVAVASMSGLIRHEPCQFRVGRITGDSLSSVSLLVARNLRRPDGQSGKPPTALILANTDYDLPLMETITRTTAQTFEQHGWQTRAMYGWQAGWYRRFGRLWGADLVLYEGHTANLTQSVKFNYEREAVHTGLYVFQGCKTLRQPEVTALLRNGAAGVVGTSTNTYSASGSALAKTYVDAMLLDEMDAGTSLMVSRNFMLALADLKELRGHEQGPKIMRGGLTFSLWGDPTWKPPQSPATPTETDRVRTVRKGNLIELHVPDTFASAVTSGDYTAHIPLGARLAGMYEWEDQERTRRQLPPLYFVVVPLPDCDGDQPPNISTPLAKNRWTSLWDARNRWLYLLVQSSARNDHDRGKKLGFRIEMPPLHQDTQTAHD